MQQTTGVAILATQLATTDRRALSQAWYSALHLAERSRVPNAGREPDRVRAQRGAAASATQQPACDRGAAPPLGAAAPRQERDTFRRAAAGAAAERRAPKTELARRIERRIARHVPHAAPASFAISAGDGRVHVFVRSDGAATRILAVCAPALRASVERALAQARFTLAARGVRTGAA